MGSEPMPNNRCEYCGGETDSLSRALPPPAPDGYRNPALACDAAIVRDGEAGTEVLLIVRGMEPFEGKLAFPGGFVEYGEEPSIGVLRELSEEVGITGHNPQLVTVRGAPERDPRKHVVTLLWHIQILDDSIPVAGDDARDVGWYKVSELMKEPERLAFDHHEMLISLTKWLNK